MLLAKRALVVAGVVSSIPGYSGDFQKIPPSPEHRWQKEVTFKAPLSSCLSVAHSKLAAGIHGSLAFGIDSITVTLTI